MQLKKQNKITTQIKSPTQGTTLKMHGKQLITYSQLSPYGHLAITDTSLLRTPRY